LVDAFPRWRSRKIYCIAQMRQEENANEAKANIEKREHGQEK